ncbi:MAG: hypothetical protein WC756_15565 [Taibaiella sp.]|jgi:hypothetical protein
MKHTFFVMAFLLTTFSCKSNTENTLSTTDHVEVKDIATDSIIVIDGYKLQPLFPKCVGINDSLKEDNEFLNSNIEYFSFDTLKNEEFKSRDFYKKILTETKFIEFMPNEFSKGNSTFNLEHLQVKNYGDCYIGKFHFPTAPNAAQLRSTVIINVAKKEISIWNFDDLKVSNSGLNCDFRVKGNHTIYKMVYSEKCKTFIPEN